MTNDVPYKVIQTEYNGYRFRSRLEARWAVAFDAMGIAYEYEPEGYELNDGAKYLPDFKLLNVRHRTYTDEFEPVFVEVKGIMSTEDLNKVERFPYPIIVVGSIPADADMVQGIDCPWYEWSFEFIDGDCYGCRFSKHKGEVWLTGVDHDEYDGGKLMNIGIAAAKKARFEHGEKGS